jgi:hypothetical protein
MQVLPSATGIIISSVPAKARPLASSFSVIPAHTHTHTHTHRHTLTHTHTHSHTHARTGDVLQPPRLLCLTCAVFGSHDVDA